jgi:hypothetical protein
VIADSSTEAAPSITSPVAGGGRPTRCHNDKPVDKGRGFSFIASTCHQPATVLNLVKDANAPLRGGL